MRLCSRNRPKNARDNSFSAKFVALEAKNNQKCIIINIILKSWAYFKDYRKAKIKLAPSPNYFDVSGIDGSPRPAAATDIVKTSMRQSRIFMAGDTNHFNGDIIGLALSPAMLTAAKDGGATHIAIEIDKGIQWQADKYMKGEISRQAFTQTIDNMYMGQQNNAEGAFTRLIVDTVDFAKNNNMQIVFADPHNGWGNKPNGMSPQDEKKWELENARDRFRDTELVDRLNSILEDNTQSKIYFAYGDAHLSVDNGNKASLNGPVTKMSLYSNRADLENFEKIMQNPEAHGRQMGWMAIKPELVYFIEEQAVATTSATPAELRRAIDEVAPAQKSIHNGFSSATSEYGLNDDQKKTLTAETAFNKVATVFAEGTEISNPPLKQKVASNANSYLSIGIIGPQT